MSECAPQARVILGDARLTLAGSPEHYDLIVVDAFSSDAIPAHLLTAEAFAVYRRHLSERGMLVLHISNKHLSLEPVVAAEAAARGVPAFIKYDRTGDQNFRYSSVVMVFPSDEASHAALLRYEGWQKASVDPSVPNWTDDYSNILGLLVKRYVSK